MHIAALPKCWLEDICSGKMGLMEWIEVSAELEVEGLELYSGFLKSHDSAYLSRVRKRVESLGMQVPMVCYSPDFTVPDEAARKREIEKQIEMIRVTAELGGAYCRTLSGQRRPALTIEQGIDIVVECIEGCLPAAEKHGVHLVIENHYKDSFWQWPEFAQKKDVFCAIVNRIDSPWFGVQYDPSNATMAGDDHIALLDAVLSRIKTMHASDRYLAPGKTLDDLNQADGTEGYAEFLLHGVTGRGMNDYDAIFTRLAGIQFAGWVSIEDGMNGMEEMKASVDFLKNMRQKYYGG